MTAFQKTNEANDLFEFGDNGFQTAQAVAPKLTMVQIATVLLLAVVAVFIAGVLTLQPANSFSAHAAGAVTTQATIAKKSDRLETAKPTTCEGQAWGAWSAECAAALSGGGAVRSVGFVTVEQTSPTVNETILARFPKAE